MKRLARRASLSFEYRTRLVRSRLACEYRELALSRADREHEQEANFARLGLSRSHGKSAIATALAASRLGAFSEDDNMFSEHLLVFGALSKALPDAREILEVGTYDGRAALLLANLFPQARVTTIDLAANDPIYAQSYQSARTAEFVRRRDETLSRSNRVQFLETNSLSLVTDLGSGRFDLVWVDGDHDFPVVAVDLANAVRLAKPGGFVMCDDVVTEKCRRSTTYLSDAAHRTLTAMRGAGLIDEPVYVYKRLGKRHQYPRKFVAIAAATRAVSRAS
jgi:predicted O-methyltransferase YrrM